jgi:hypothetical protein
MKELNAFRKFLKEGDKSVNPTHIIKTDVYYINDYGDFYQEAVPKYELDREGVEVRDVEDEDENSYLYIESGVGGWYNEEEGHFETVDGSDTRIEKEYIHKIIEV